MPAVSESRYLVTAGWAHVPHLTEKAKSELRRSTLPHLRDAREFGTPSLGSGAIYPIPVSEITCDPFPPPPGWRRGYALDVGWRATAAVWLMEDPSDGCLYAYSEYKRGQAEPTTHAAAIKARGDWITGAIDPAARQRAQRDGEELMAQYQGLGLGLVTARNDVSAGLSLVWMLLSEGRLVLFRTLAKLLAEYRVYHRDEKGRLVKTDDHLLDALRYAVMTWSAIASLPTAKRQAPTIPLAVADRVAGL